MTNYQQQYDNLQDEVYKGTLTHELYHNVEALENAIADIRTAIGEDELAKILAKQFDGYDSKGDKLELVTLRADFAINRYYQEEV